MRELNGKTFLGRAVIRMDEIGIARHRDDDALGLFVCLQFSQFLQTLKERTDGGAMPFPLVRLNLTSYKAWGFI